MSTTTSKDGTTLAYDVTGSGPALVLVSGASTTRASNQEYAEQLSADFTVYNYDRRGRGDSDTKSDFTGTIAVEREFEDLDAIIAEAGGAAAVLGFSSGAVLALKATANGAKVTDLVLWETPFSLDEGGPARQATYAAELHEHLAAGRNGDAAALFMNLVGLPPEMIANIRNSPMWPGLEAVAPSLAYDAAAMGDSRIPDVSGVTARTLVLDGGASPAFLQDAATALTKALPNAERTTLEGQDHSVSANALVPVVRKWLGR
ncbi:alpha/beta hydrolase [Kribbella sp. NBC_01245]|uniref:alpha/beta fold hydrolase n=1 Tax=Kribbella sp. NBC_01245 TaxID=2903578 RepID=UPI002E28A079|nr:alpha/beta hydrolase [Kribbella sp. NBC_01245]